MATVARLAGHPAVRWSAADLLADVIVSRIDVRAMSRPGRPNLVVTSLPPLTEAVVRCAPGQVAARTWWRSRAVRLGHAAARLSAAALIEGVVTRPPDEGFDPDAHPGRVKQTAAANLDPVRDADRR
jgi:hypothetical protein